VQRPLAMEGGGVIIGNRKSKKSKIALGSLVLIVAPPIQRSFSFGTSFGFKLSSIFKRVFSKSGESVFPTCGPHTSRCDKRLLTCLAGSHRLRNQLQPREHSSCGLCLVCSLYLFRFLFLSSAPGDGAETGIAAAAMGAAGRRAVGTGPDSLLTGTPMCRPYRPLRPLPSSSLMQSSAGIPASRHLPQGLCLSQPFLLLRQRWHRGLVERSGWSSSPGSKGNA
jgi:hypothetical protein